MVSGGEGKGRRGVGRGCKARMPGLEKVSEGKGDFYRHLKRGSREHSVSWSRFFFIIIYIGTLHIIKYIKQKMYKSVLREVRLF